MLTAVGIIGIIAALLLMLFLAYRGMNTIYAAPLTLILVCLTNGIPIINSYVEVYMGGFVGIIKTLFSFFILGAILGRLYSDTGAAASIAQGVLKLTGGIAKTDKGKRQVAVISLILIALILGYGGINALVLVFATYPIAVSLSRSLNIPRRFISGWLSTANCFVFCAPGAPQTANVLAGNMLGTPNDAAMIPGLIGGIIIVGGAIVYLCVSIEKDIANGGRYTEHPNKTDFAPDRQLPNVAFAVIPILAVFITFTILNSHIVFSLFLGIVLTVLLMYRNIPQKGNFISNLAGVANPAVQMAAPTIMALGALSGFGAVVQTTAAFGVVANSLINLPGPPLLVAGFIVAIVVGFTSSAPAGLTIALTIFGPTFLSAGVNPAALHRVAAFATSTLDSLPNSGGVITNLTLTGQTHKQAYKPVFIITVVLTASAMIVCAFVCTLFPSIV